MHVLLGSPASVNRFSIGQQMSQELSFWSPQMLNTVDIENAVN